MAPPRTAEAIAQMYAQEFPLQRFAHSADGNTVGIEQDGTYWAFASLTLLGTWVAAPHVLVNGKRPIRQWIAVPVPPGQ